jgi:hypothetical protein
MFDRWYLFSSSYVTALLCLVRHAYEVLSDPRRRETYDAIGERGMKWVEEVSAMSLAIYFQNAPVLNIDSYISITSTSTIATVGGSARVSSQLCHLKHPGSVQDLRNILGYLHCSLFTTDIGVPNDGWSVGRRCQVGGCADTSLGV